MKNYAAIKGQGTAPSGIPEIEICGKYWREVATKPRRNVTGPEQKSPGSTESVHRFTLNAAGALNGARRQGKTGRMIPATQSSGRTPFRALAEKPESAARRIDLQN